ncbi:cdc42 effector protein 4 [Latimeria chalumnae]|uniref:CDC42 effector protein 4 n=1 Tax=Latimeria chalumnae TaxID=7897 RepID=H3BGI8_LATCH|nr:PREDICTED: cdc42 effector protein 4 [Latimeria chalumnae]|eukprot:XP_005988119.1 PREDICTED: cdc42 effector protein 4 [Latimeria chalumnae]
MPILKQLMSNSASSKRRSRADLTAEMISAPLGDFRHTMHVGRGGDAFGDTSFLNSRTGDAAAEEPSPKHGLLSRKFRSSSKRSHSVTRSDKRDTFMPSRDSAIFVKNAVSLPQLTDKEEEKSARKVPKSLSSSPLKKLPADAAEETPINGASANALEDQPFEPLVYEHEFGDLTDLPASPPKNNGFGLKHAESIMSFHIDLGPSMLGDVLSIMDKSYVGGDDLDLGMKKEDDDYLRDSTCRPGLDKEPDEEHFVASKISEQEDRSTTYSPGSGRSFGSHLLPDNSSVSSSASGVLEERPPTREEEKDFSFMDEDDDDEIRV